MSDAEPRRRVETEWLTLGEAARMLGVDETTLRAWADAGKVRVYRTPGGHRRFNASDVDTLLREAPRHHFARPPRSSETESPRHWFASRPWFTRVDDDAWKRARVQCARLMHALEGYLDARAEMQDLGGARRIGADLGREVARWGLTPAQSTEVFLHFKRGVFDMLSAAPRAPSGRIRSLRDADAFLGEALQAMIGVLEERPAQARHPSR
ncbi:MAG TPA: helix-turn-helix domain-containing protein [bacterium]|nr:helix-turn-helix domain-containing protein [bacterium]